MPNPTPPSNAPDADRKRPAGVAPGTAATQPAATGASGGSPAASVMKQTQKTSTEGSGRT